MKLVIDMQGAQTESRFRGIGRYTLSLVKEIVRQCGDHEVVLVLNGALFDSIESIKTEFNTIISENSILVCQINGPVMAIHRENDSRREQAEFIYEAFIASLNPDVVLITSLFETAAVSSIGLFRTGIPSAVILYDLIPLIYSKVYLQDTNTSKWYFEKIDHIRRADLLLSISFSSGDEAKQYLNIPEKNVVNISTASDEHFAPISITEKDRAELKSKFGISGDYVMYTGDIDWRKDLEGLFASFYNLPEAIRKKYKLVLVGRSLEKAKDHFIALANTIGLAKTDLIFTGYVSEDDLVLLYNACTLFVFPSWHEGFGLPVLEAMSCGKAVIAANSSSLPEVVGRADALFTPRDNADMSAKMAAVLGNPAFRQELERHGLEQAKKFSWEVSAQRAWQALEKLHQEHPRPKITLPLPQRPRLAFVSPLPPEKTGIADYAAELLPELARHYDITVIVEQADVSDDWVRANTPIRNADWFREHSQQFDRVVYQFGNSDRHVYMFDLLAEIPGLVVLHDFYLSGVLAWVMEDQSAHRFSWTKALHAAHGWRSVQERFIGKNIEELVWQYPCNLKVLQQAQGVIVHSNYSRQLAHRFYGEHNANDWALIPHLRRPAEHIDKALARQQLGLAEKSFVVCSFGVIGATKLNQRLLDAWLASPLAKNSLCQLVFVGENQGGEYGNALQKTISQSSEKDRITITGWTDSDIFRTWLAAADVGVQLRTLSRGETSGTVLDCMNYGLPTIVNANGSMADLPSDAVWLMPDEFTDQELIDALSRLYEDASYRMELGQRAQAHIHRHHNPRSCADQYAIAIETVQLNANQGIVGLTKAMPRLTPSPNVTELPQLVKTLAANFPPKMRKPQLLLDVSALVKTDLWSGIERVTRALLQEIALNEHKDWQIEPVYAVPEQEGYRYARKFMSRFLGVPDDWAEDAPVRAWQGDIFLGMDLQPQVVDAQKHTLENWRNQGIKCYFVIYDLLPVTMPEVFPEGAKESHHYWLTNISQFDGALCISRAVADEMFDWLQTFGEQRERPFALNWFHLGADVDNSAPSLGLPTSASQTLAEFKTRPTFLMVGTIEPRKGHLQTVQAFDALWAQGVDVNLVIVGKEGWKPLPNSQRRDIPQTVNALRKHPELHKRLFWLEGISDEYLEQVYARATCLIAASFDEGYGLPLIETARHGVPLLVRDIPVFREVTDGHAFFFNDSRDPKAIAEAVQAWLALFNQDAHPRSTAMPHQTWRDSGQQVLGAILGNATPYKTWLPDGVRRYWGNDPRLQTQVGERIIGKTIQTTGVAGFLFYGAYTRFKKGNYRLIIQGAAEYWSGEERIDITCSQGTKIIHSDLLRKQSAGAYKEIVSFSLDEECPDMEIRLWVNAHSNLNVKNIEIKNTKLNNCFAYFVTETHLDRLENSLIKQGILGVDLKDDRVLVTDADLNIIEKYPAINSYFLGNVVLNDPWVIDDDFKKQFNFSKLRNAAIDYARFKDFGYMAFCDSDTILTFDSLSIDLKINFAVPNVYWQREESEDVLKSMEIIKNDPNPFSQGNSWFIISRKIINNTKFNEAIIGYGYEDIEFWAKCNHVYG